MQTFFDDGDEHVGAHGNPYLRLHGVLAGAQKCLDPQVLLDPFEEQFDLPSLTVQVGNQFGLQCEVVGQESDALSGVVLDHHPAQSCWVALARIKHGQYAGLIANDLRGTAIHRVRVTPLELGVALGAGDKEGLGLVDDKQPGEIQIPAIQSPTASRPSH